MTYQGPITARRWKGSQAGAVLLGSANQQLGDTVSDAQTEALIADLQATIAVPTPTPTPTPTPPPAPSPGPTGVLWQPELTVGRATFPNAQFPGGAAEPGSVVVVADPTYGEILNFAITPTDFPYVGDTDPRADLESPAIIKQGDEVYIGITCRIPSLIAPACLAPDYPWFLLFEMYGEPYGGSPSVCLALTAYEDENDDNHWCLKRSAEYDYDAPWIGPAVDTNWHEFVYRVKLDTEANGGGCAIRMDGAIAMPWLGYSTWVASNSGGPNFVNIQQYRGPGGWPRTVVSQHAQPWIATGWSPA